MLNRLFPLFFLCLLGLAGCGGGDANRPSVNGEWALTLHPTGKPATDDGAINVQVLLAQKGSAVTGYTNAFTLSGNRSGDVLDLDVLGTGKDGLDVKQGKIRLVLTDQGTASGTGLMEPENVPLLGDVVKNQPGESEVSGFDVSAQRVSSLKYAEVMSRIEQATNGSSDLPQGIAKDVCDGLGSLMSFVVGSLTDNALRPMGNCPLTKDGAGYYLFGRNAPGSLLPVWTQNVYMPSTWGACLSTRTYHFTFSYDGQAPLATGIELLAKSRQGNGYFPGMDNFLSPSVGIGQLAAALDSFRSKYGNYAFLLATHPRTHWIGLYVITERGGENDIKNEHIVKTLAGNLGASVMAGHTIKDTFGLYVSPVGCGDNVIFAYLIGTAKVNLD